MTWERKPFVGNCDNCRAYWEVGQDLGEAWHAAAPADRPPISDQITRNLVMYCEHMAAHLPA